MAAAAAGVWLYGQWALSERYRRLIAEGELAIQQGESFRALESLSGALALRPQSMLAYYRRAEAYRLQERVDEAVADLTAASRLSPGAPEPLTLLGDVYSERDEPAEAARWYTEAVERLRDEDPALLHRLAYATYRAGDPRAALTPAERAAARNDAAGPTHYLLGLIYRDVGRIDAATAALEQAVRAEPTLTAAREELADLYGMQRRTVDQMRELQALAALDGATDRQIAIASAQLDAREYSAALSTLASALRLAPNDSRLHLAVGRVHLARAASQPDPIAIAQAVQALERALGGTARRSEGLMLYGQALARSGDLAGAERILVEATRTSPVDPEAFRHLADIAERMGHAQAARDALARLDALEGDTATPAVRLDRARRIGLLSLQTGDVRSAADYLTRAAAGGLDDPVTLGRLASARWLGGDIEGARAALASALAKSPKDAELLRLARSLK